MTAKDLLGILKDLTKEEFDEFKWHVRQPYILDGTSRIQAAKLKDARMWDTVTLMVNAYTLNGALKVAKKALEEIPRIDLVQRLSDTCSGPEVNVQNVGRTLHDRGPPSTQSKVSVDGKDVGGTSDNRGPSSSQSEVSVDVKGVGGTGENRRLSSSQSEGAEENRGPSFSQSEVLVDVKGTGGAAENEGPSYSESEGSLACQLQLKSTLKMRFQCVFEGIAKGGNPALLNQIYTELFIIEGGAAEVNHEHEVRQIESLSRKQSRLETTIRENDIFKAPPGRDEPIRTVMTKGVAGIGKTVLTQKFTLDWAEDKANQDIHFTFPFTFRELNLLKEKKYSLLDLVHHFFIETKEICRFEEFFVLFIFDGLDECRFPLDFYNNEIVTDVTEPTSVDVLLTNLIRGKLLPSAHLWITTRPAAANQIPAECIDMVTEVRGFTDPQKEEYFRRRFRDEEQASSIISHIKTARSLYIMCHIPVFCWITATVLEMLLKTRERGELPKTLTEMYIHFLMVQLILKKIKYDGGAETDPHWTPEIRKMIESLGKLAFEQLQKGNLIFYSSDLMECGFDIRAASVYSGVFTQIFREERGLYQDKVFCFIHLTVQEFLAALHVHLTFINSGVNLLYIQHQI